MEILNQRINVKAVKAYQTVEMEMTISNATNDEVKQVKAYLLNEAKNAVSELARDIEASNAPVQASTNVQQFQPQKKQPTYRTDNNYQQPQVPVQNTQPINTVMYNGFQYKLCTNNQTGEKFYALVDHEDLRRGATKKYLKPEEINQ